MKGLHGITSINIEPNEIVIGSPRMPVRTERAADTESASGVLQVSRVKGGIAFCL